MVWESISIKEREGVLMREPYWMINRKTIKAWHKSNWSLLKLIYVWLRVQWFFFYSLNFKSCKKEHFLGMNMMCLRCKKSKFDIDRERITEYIDKEMKERGLDG